MAKVLVPLDGSALAESAIPIAALFARVTGDEPQLLHAIEAFQSSGQMIERAEAYLEGALEKLRQLTDVPAQGRVAIGVPSESILEAARQDGVALLVMSTHGRTGLARTVLGSVADAVVKAAPVPVFLVPSKVKPVDRPQLARILAPLDGSEYAHAIVGPLAELASRFEAEVLLLQVAPGPYEFVDRFGRLAAEVAEPADRFEQAARQYLDAVQAELTGRGIRVTSLYRLGEVANQVLQVVESHAADAIALTTHGRTGLDRVRHGSVAEALLGQGPVPMFVLGREATRRLWAQRWQARSTGEAADGPARPGSPG